MERESDPLFQLQLDTNEKRAPEMMDKGGIKIPKLDLSMIHMQREVTSSHQDESDEDEGSYYEEGEEEEDMDSETRK